MSDPHSQPQEWKSDIPALARAMTKPIEDPDTAWQPEAIITLANEYLADHEELNEYHKRDDEAAACEVDYCMTMDENASMKQQLAEKDALIERLRRFSSRHRCRSN